MSNGHKQSIIDFIKQLFLELKALGVTFETIGRVVDRETSDELTNARSIWARIEERVVAQNPTMVSKELVAKRLLFKTVQQALHYIDAEQELEADASKDLDELFTYSIVRKMNLPIVHLVVDDEGPIKFGKVSFFKINDDDRKTDWWERIESHVGGFSSWVEAYAQIGSPGDLQLSVENAKAILQEHLLYIRGIGFPITDKTLPQIAMVGDLSVPGGIPIRIIDIMANYKIEYPSKLVVQLGALPLPHKLKTDLLHGYENPQVLKITEMIVKENKDQLELERKFLQGLRWIGDATLPGDLNFRYLKVCLALEALMGGEAADEWLIARGITATLAERSAFIAGSSQTERIEIDKLVKRHYRKRSDLVHGSDSAITDYDFIEFATLVRKIAFDLLDKVADIKTINGFQEWVNSNRYR